MRLFFANSDSLPVLNSKTTRFFRFRKQATSDMFDFGITRFFFKNHKNLEFFGIENFSTSIPSFLKSAILFLIPPP